MNTLWGRAINDMSLEQMNHHERENVLPMAFSFSHFMRAQDQSVSGVFRKERPLWVSGEWAAKTAISIDVLGREETVEEMQHLRIGDLDAWKDYQAQVIQRTTDVLPTLTPELRQEVAEHFREDTLKLQELVGLDLSDWLDDDREGRRSSVLRLRSLRTPSSPS